jgi:hypothetical protein
LAEQDSGFVAACTALRHSACKLLLTPLLIMTTLLLLLLLSLQMGRPC